MNELDLAIRNHVYRRFVESGRALPAAEAALELELDPGEAAAAYRRLHDARALVLEPAGDGIRMLNPFSVVPTPHRVEAAGRAWYGNCAWDALAVPAALAADGRLESECACCEQPASLRVESGELVDGRELLVHILVPARHWWDDIVFT